MSKFDVKNSEGTKVAEAELAAEVYGIEPNLHVMHHIVTCQQACWRQGTQSAKTRSEVSGGGKKPWRQKGTGRARQGSTRSPQWRHGGVVFAPKPRSYAKRMNNKEVKLAMRSALSAKVRDNELVLVDDYGFEKPSTKAAVAMLKALGLEGKRLTIIVREDDINAYLSFRNIPKTFIITPNEANTYDLVNNGALLMPADVATHFGEVLA
ncbi:50S ribosomal protein L4 [Collinsella tanakaei]|uniref:Large ribosomal subunit protein uL4 n=1 Tax=Collinsella tanakaei YIT 12063 TaxID=742742 RepID=G1WKN6_9ACTN|nr:50S ribosomal protein L4 [Collinsella tanakaei]EGX68981.1 50S ribosomal protein L4/L1 [Collinsella tanakaei YIT 12063]